MRSGVWISLVGLVGCVGAHELGDAGGAPDASDDASDVACPQIDAVVAFEEAQRDAMCSRGLQCLTEGSLFALGAYDSFVQYCRVRIDRAARCAQLAAGEVVFDPDAADRCLVGYREWSSTPCYLRVTEADYGPFPRLLLDGGSPLAACTSALREVAPADCSQSACPAHSGRCVADGRCGGTCILAAREGERCNWSLRCGEHLFCDASGTCRLGCANTEECAEGAYCVRNQCTVTALPDVGEPCLPVENGELLCATNAFCDLRSRTCATRALLGEACAAAADYDYVCQYGECVGGVCTRSSRCLPDGWGPSTWGCDPVRPYCGIDGTCTDDVTRVACSAATEIRGLEACPAGLRCDLRGGDRVDGACRPEAPVGSRCDSTVVCADGTRCTVGRCVTLAAPGQPCGPDVPCAIAELYACTHGVCGSPRAPFAPDPPRPTIGEHCDAAAPCEAGACVDGTCQWLASLAPCSASSECPVHNCSRGAICGPYAFAGDGETCDDVRSPCAPPLVCLETRELDAAGAPRRICRAACAP